MMESKSNSKIIVLRLNLGDSFGGIVTFKLTLNYNLREQVEKYIALTHPALNYEEIIDCICE